LLKNVLRILNILRFFVSYYYFELKLKIKMFLNKTQVFLMLSIIALSTISVIAQTKKPVAKAPIKKPVTPGTVKSAKPAAVSGLKSEADSLSYAIGVNIGSNIKSQNLKVNSQILAKALDDVMAGNDAIMSSDASGAFLQNYFQKQSNKVGDGNKSKGDAFLAENKKKEGVVTLPSGLQYKILNEGSGPKPASTDKVKVHYHGTLIDGTVFDSSVNRGEPAEFGVTQVIQGWIEALQLMPVGSKWTLYIPSSLAYGPQGPPSIGPNQTLIFDVELLDIVK
jgi:FKBP-type peptidyl-prolyl cis-trans isomerase FklB